MASSLLEAEPHQISDIFGLPRELRDKIWEAILVPKSIIWQRIGGSSSFSEETLHIPTTDILLINSQMTREVLVCVTRRAVLRLGGSFGRPRAFIAPVPMFTTRLEVQILSYFHANDARSIHNEVRNATKNAALQVQSQALHMAGLKQISVELKILTGDPWENIRTACLQSIFQEQHKITSIPKLSSFSVSVRKLQNFMVLHPTHPWLQYLQTTGTMEVVSTPDVDNDEGEDVDTSTYASDDDEDEGRSETEDGEADSN